MSTSFRTDAGGLWTEQREGSALDYTLDWSDTLDPSDTIASSAWIVDTGLVSDRTSADDSTTTTWLSGGIGGTWYRVSNTVTTGTGRIHVKGFRLFVQGSAAPAIKSVFPDLGGEVMALRRDRLAMATRLYAPGFPFTDEYLLGKLVSAEAEVQRALRVFLLPREVVPDGTPQSEIDALVSAGETVHIEPGYDFDPVQYQGAWGPIDVRHRPIIALRGITFHYPMNLNALYEVDLQWARIDKKYGRVQFVPFGAFMSGQLGGFFGGMVGLGAKMPLMVRVRYRSGLENVARDWPDILSAIRSAAVLGVLSDLVIPSSGSVSGDGLTQTMAFKIEAHRQGLDDKLERLRQAIHGIRFAVV